MIIIITTVSTIIITIAIIETKLNRKTFKRMLNKPKIQCHNEKEHTDMSRQKE